MSHPKPFSDDESAAERVKNFEDDHFEIAESYRTSQPTMITTSLDLAKTIIFSKPFLVVVIIYLLYTMWRSRSKGTRAYTPAEPPTSAAAERLSLRRSLRPNVTMARK